MLDAIDAAAEAGLTPVKIDVVVKRGMNDRDIADIARRFRGTGHIVRFIEYMDVGNSNGWRIDDVVPGARDRLDDLQPSRRSCRPTRTTSARSPSAGARPTAPARSASSPRSPNRSAAPAPARASRPNGELYLCLFAGTGHDLRALLRGGATDDDLRRCLASIWRARDDRYSEERSAATPGLRKVEMSHIGG